jgi:hypothetical protein
LVSGVNTVNVTFTATAACVNGIEIGFEFGALTTGTVGLGEVQLEQGSVATPFEQRPIGTELALCQRYYWRSVLGAFAPLGLASTQSSSLGRLMINLPVTMRIAPSTIGTYGSALEVPFGTLSTITFDRSSTDMLMLAISGSGYTPGGVNVVYGNGNGTSSFDVSAEL